MSQRAVWKQKTARGCWTGWRVSEQREEGETAKQQREEGETAKQQLHFRSTYPKRVLDPRNVFGSCENCRPKNV